MKERLLMEGVAKLHQRGFGRLKLLSYVKEGLGAWRVFLFAGDQWPDQLSDIPEPSFSCRNVEGDLPAFESGMEAARVLEERIPTVLKAARGRDAVYEQWFARLLEDHPVGILVMEDAERARVGHQVVPKPWSLGGPLDPGRPRARGL